eukprot:1801072-Prorocentrum_lima.AAC.1
MASNQHPDGPVLLDATAETTPASTEQSLPHALKMAAEMATTRPEITAIEDTNTDTDATPSPCGQIDTEEMTATKMNATEAPINILKIKTSTRTSATP